MSGKKILCCGILRHEMEHLLKGYGIEVDYVDEALHVDLDKLGRVKPLNSAEEVAETIVSRAGL